MKKIYPVIISAILILGVILTPTVSAQLPPPDGMKSKTQARDGPNQGGLPPPSHLEQHQKDQQKQQQASITKKQSSWSKAVQALQAKLASLKASASKSSSGSKGSSGGRK